MYPGQNYLQTLVINPGVVRSYHIPPLPTSLYAVSDGTPAPTLSAESIVIQDAGSSNILYAKNPDLPLLPASTTKIMTALIALDYYNLANVLTIRNEDRAVGSTMKLYKGEEITVESLLYGLLVGSGNDAALALADNFPGGYDAFILAMNEKAAALHLNNTVYTNVSGVESYGHATTARDLSILAQEAVKNPIINRIMQTQSITVTDVSGQVSHPLINTNQLLGKIQGVIGLKTGWTENSGECLVTYISRDGHDIVLVILNSADRFGETTRLIDWVYRHHTWQPLTP